MIGSIKLASIFILFGLATFSGIISCVTVRCLIIRLGSSPKFKRALSTLNCFSGGVFFATCVLNLLPEARKSMTLVLENNDIQTEYPLTELSMCLGFFFILILENCAYACCSSNSRQGNQTRGERSTDRVPTSRNTLYKRVATEDPMVVTDFEDSSYKDDILYQTYGAADESIDKSPSRPYTEVAFQDSDRVLIKRGSIIADGKPLSTKDVIQAATESAEHDPVQSKLRGIVLLIALSLHMIFDGLALGLLKADKIVWGLLVALSLHKLLVFFTIGIQTLEILASLKKTTLLILVFALMSPCGIIIGDSLTSSGESLTKDMLSAILQGIAAGTFLYVTFFEILQRELGSDDHDLLKVFVTVLGFALVASIPLIEQDES